MSKEYVRIRHVVLDEGTDDIFHEELDILFLLLSLLLMPSVDDRDVRRLYYISKICWSIIIEYKRRTPPCEGHKVLMLRKRVFKHTSTSLDFLNAYNTDE